MSDPSMGNRDMVEDGTAHKGARMRAIMKRSPAFIERSFSCEERAYCDATASPEFHYASRFAAKEAVVKALGTGFRHGIRPNDIEVYLNAKGKPRVRLHRAAAKIAAHLGIEEIPLSLSYTHNEAVACALALTEDSRTCYYISSRFVASIQRGSFPFG